MLGPIMIMREPLFQVYVLGTSPHPNHHSTSTADFHAAQPNYPRPSITHISSLFLLLFCPLPGMDETGIRERPFGPKEVPEEEGANADEAAAAEGEGGVGSKLPFKMSSPQESLIEELESASCGWMSVSICLISFFVIVCGTTGGRLGRAGGGTGGGGGG